MRCTGAAEAIISNHHRVCHIYLACFVFFVTTICVCCPTFHTNPRSIQLPRSSAFYTHPRTIQSLIFLFSACCRAQSDGQYRPDHDSGGTEHFGEHDARQQELTVAFSPVCRI
jgi:hypothetical protein